jgi:predicted nucleic acid-binding protein
LTCYFFETTAFAKLFVREQGTDSLIELMESLPDNSKLIAASAPLEIYAAIRRRERSGALSPQDASSALEILRQEAARMVQEPLNPAVLESARLLLDKTPLRWPDALQLAAAITARDMFQETEIVFVSSMPALLDAARVEGFRILNPTEDNPEEPEE